MNKAPNRLINEKSPYLLQHAYNPVDWYPWGEEAFRIAKDKDKPVFLSIGYSTCHWCHVMEKESFEDEEVASLLNNTFVNIKLDREERPDIDAIYMTVCQMMTGGGGWPLTIVMTPDKKPFFAGTYFPKKSKNNRPGLIDLIRRIDELWKHQREELLKSSEESVNALARQKENFAGGVIPPDIMHSAYSQFLERFDTVNGGFGNAPKFPTPHNFSFLTRYSYYYKNDNALEMTTKTLVEMRKGGIYDQIGGGFHRYSTDRRWLLPHFEKMLYDQALLIIAYTEAFQLTGDFIFRKTVEDTIKYVFRDMWSPEGAFYSAEDADSEGEEGKFYLWTLDEIKNSLGSDAGLFSVVYNIESGGNFYDPFKNGYTGENIPYLKATIEELAVSIGMEETELRKKLLRSVDLLFEIRNKREHPHKDDKILTDWNGLLLAALAKAYKVFNHREYLDAAIKCAEFLYAKMTLPDGSLLHRYRDGVAGIDGMLEDYAFVIWGLLELYETEFNSEYLVRAKKLSDIVINNFRDEEIGGFYFTSADSEKLIVRQKEVYDGAIPSGNSVMIQNLFLLSRYTGDFHYADEMLSAINAFSGVVGNSPSGFSQFISGVMVSENPFYELVIVGNQASDEARRIIREIHAQFLPHVVVLFKDVNDSSKSLSKIAPFTDDMIMIDGQMTFYLCKDSACQLPTVNFNEVMENIMEMKI